MPVIQGTKKGKAKMKGSNTQKCSAGKKKKKKGEKGSRNHNKPQVWCLSQPFVPCGCS